MTTEIKMATNGRYMARELTSHPSKVTLNIGIVGAGIAGLTAAASLSRAGHNVEVSRIPGISCSFQAVTLLRAGLIVEQLYERSQFANELGAAITLGPNAGSVLHALGFSHERAKTRNVEEVGVSHSTEWAGLIK